MGTPQQAGGRHVKLHGHRIPRKRHDRSMVTLITDRPGGSMPTRRIFELIVITNVLFWPARSTVLLWARKQLATQPPGSFMHGAGEVAVTVL
jgi:hypothetical protein